MEFDKSKVYTALNADELKVGYKCIFANNLDSLKCKVEEGTDIRPIVQILNDAYERRFKTDVRGEYPFAYLVSEPEETWIVYLCRRKGVKPYLTSCRSDVWEKVQKDYGAKTKLFEGTDDISEEWYESRRHLTDVIAAWEDGKTIQCFMTNTETWEDLKQPSFQPELKYRIKPEPLKWTDLKLGDIVHSINTGTDIPDIDIEAMVTAIDKNTATGFHVMIANDWTTDEHLAKGWEKVE